MGPAQIAKCSEADLRKASSLRNFTYEQSGINRRYSYLSQYY